MRHLARSAWASACSEGACGLAGKLADEGYGGILAEPAACEAEHEDGAIACEFDVPGRPAVRDGIPDGLGKAEDLGNPACCFSGITVEHVGDRSRIAARRLTCGCGYAQVADEG